MTATISRFSPSASGTWPIATRPKTARVLVIGAGPAGLATAACLQQAGMQFDMIDRSGQPAGAYGHLHGGITLSSPAKFTQLPGLPIEASATYITIAEYRTYLDRYAAHFDLHPEEQYVESIERRGGRFAVKFASEPCPRYYEAVVAATGMCDHPVYPQIEGLAEARSKIRVIHSRDWPGPEALAGSRVLIIGGASSGIAIAEQCAEAGLACVVSARRQQMRFSFTRIFGFDLRRWVYPLTRRLPRWLFGKRCSLHPAFVGTERGFRGHQRSGLITVRGPVVRFDGRQVTFAEGLADRFDVVVLATGYRFNMPYLPKEVARAPAGQPLADNGQSRSWPGLYFVGIPCANSIGSEFLHGIAADAPAVARRIRQQLQLAPRSQARPSAPEACLKTSCQPAIESSASMALMT
jgi:putative flavoprotein involved in K+ transport